MVCCMELLVSVGMQMAKSLMKLIHKHTIVGLAEVFVSISSELIIAVNHSSNSLHDPFCLVDWAYDILIAIKNCNRNFINSRERNI